MGAPGAARPSPVVSAVVDGGRSVEEAVGAPRLHWDTDHVEMEPGWPPEVVQALEARWPVNVWPGPDVYFGGVHAVAPGPDGGAAGDPRRDGAVAEVS